MTNGTPHFSVWFACMPGKIEINANGTRLKLSSESWGVLQTLLSRIDYTENTRGSKSGLIEGYSFLLMNAGMWAWILLWVILEPSDGAESCWRVQGAAPKCLRAQGSSSASKMSKGNASCSVTPLRVPKRVEIFLWLWLPPAQTITESGFWRRLTLLRCKNYSHLFMKGYDCISIYSN